MWNTTGLGRAVRASLVTAPHLPTRAEAGTIRVLPEPKTNKGIPRTWEILLSIFPRRPNPERPSA